MTEMTQATGTVPEWTLGWRLQRALAYADMSVEEMAAEIGVHRGTVSRWLNDRGAEPRPAFVKMWALRCGVPYEWLTTGHVNHGSRTTSNQALVKAGAARARARRIARSVEDVLGCVPCVL